MMDLLIIGCGYVGTEVGAYYVREGWSVAGLVRSEERKIELEQKNILPIIADLTKPETLINLPEAKHVLICPSSGKREAAAYKEIYVEGVANYLDVLSKQTPLEKIIYISSTGIYSQDRSEWIDETTDPKPTTERSQLLLQAEQQILSSSFPSIIFRLSGIYGPGRNRIEAVRSDKIPLIDTDRFMNLIHLDDIVQGIYLLFEKGLPGEIYLGVDDAPVKQSEMYGWLMKQLNLEETAFEFGDKAIQGKQCSNKKLKQLGFKPKYPSFREGYKKELES